MAPAPSRDDGVRKRLERDTGALEFRVPARLVLAGVSDSAGGQ